MPKLLRFIFDLLGFIMGVAIVRGVIYTPILLVIFLCNGLLRVPTMLVELIVLRPYLVGERIKKALFQIDMYATLVLMPLFFSIFIVQGLLARIQIHPGLLLGITILMLVLIGLCEVYIKADFIKRRNLTTSIHKVVTRLYCIAVPFWMLSYIVTMLLLGMIGYFLKH